MLVGRQGARVILFNFEGPEVDAEKWGCSSAGRAPALQAGGREFEPHHLHQRSLKGPREWDERTG